MPEFAFTELLPLGPDTTPYRLLTTEGMPEVFVKLNLDALLRPALTDRYESHATGIASGFLTINEARRLEDLPPVPWGDQPFLPQSQPGANQS